MAGRVGEHVERLGIRGSVEQDGRAEAEGAFLLVLELVA